MNHELLNLEKLGKTLALTASSSDGEALAAARAAVRLVQQANLTYPDLFDEMGNETKIGVNRSDQSCSASLQQMLFELRREIEQLRARQGHEKKDRGDEIASLKTRLLAEAPLHRSERIALIQISCVRPNSREHFYILWLARQHRLRL